MRSPASSAVFKGLSRTFLVFPRNLASHLHRVPPQSTPMQDCMHSLRGIVQFRSASSGGSDRGFSEPGWGYDGCFEGSFCEQGSNHLTDCRPTTIWITSRAVTCITIPRYPSRAISMESAPFQPYVQADWTLPYPFDEHFQPTYFRAAGNTT